MSVKTFQIREIRRTAVQQHQQAVGTGDYNRFSPLDPRQRILSVGKRKLDPKDNIDVNAAKAPRYDSSTVFKQLKDNDTVLADVETALENADKSLGLDSNCSPEVKTAMGFYSSALKLLLKSQKTLSSTLVDAFGTKQQTWPTGGQTSGKQVKPPAPEIPPEVAAAKKVKQVLREAEKKTVIFDLDLGKAPTMNKETLSKKVTMALNTKIQSGEHDYDIKDAEDVLDDILSCAKLEFLGTASKSFFNKRNVNDVRNDTMCTLPVRFEFKDRDVRIQAETTLRKVCKVKCATPYPKRLRDIMNNLVTQGKKLSPNCFIRTRVNVDNLSIEVHAKTSNGWKDLNLNTSIPLDVCDKVSTDVVPSSEVVAMNIS
jgi:hypothetical protein